MIYLDTSALIKLYLIESGSEELDQVVVSQDEPLPIWEIQEAELHNAFRLKVFRSEISEEAANQLAMNFRELKRKGFYYTPDLDRFELIPTFHQFSRHTQTLGCQTLDILHVVCAHLIEADTFISYDQRQCRLAEKVGLTVKTPQKRG